MTLRLGDFTVGRRFALAEYTVSEQEITEFARRYDPQGMHTDALAARATPMGELIASGWHTSAIAMRLMVDAYIGDAATIASPGIDNIRWLAPVRPGDVLTGTCEVTEARVSRSKPDRGIVRCRVALRRKGGEDVMTMETMTILLV